VAEPKELTVWTYWEGPCPDYIQLCIQSMRRWCNLRLLDRKGFDDLWLEDCDLAVDGLYIAHRADFIRAYLLHHYGGAWIDADCIVLKPIAPLASYLADHDLVYYREPGGTVTNNFFLANPQTPLTRFYYEAVTAHLRANRPIQWLEIGSVPLTAAIQSNPSAAFELPTESIMPIAWNESQRFLDPVPEQALEQASHGAGTLHNAQSICYMLSNHSMPDLVKTLSKEELLTRPVLLTYLFHAALGADLSPAMAANYCYWRLSGGDWGPEYNRRKDRHPFFHIQEFMIADHVAHHSPCRVLEWGCGTGRHLRNLSQIPGVEAFGFDQSQTMLDAGFHWASTEWRAAHLAIGDPAGRLPYDDGAFDLVFTCEALLHTRPEDLEGRLSEFARICRGHVLHLESPPSWTGYSSSCNGCWGHDLPTAYGGLGRKCEILPSGFRHQVPYMVRINPDSVRWTWHPAMLSLYERLDLSIEQGFRQAEVPARA